MLTLRRVWNPLKYQVSSIGIPGICCSVSEIVGSLDESAHVSRPFNASVTDKYLSLKKSYHCASSIWSSWKLQFSSKTGQYKLEDEVSKPQNEDELISEPVLFEDDENIDMPLLHKALKVGGGGGVDANKNTWKKSAYQKFVEVVLNVHGYGQASRTRAELDKFVDTNFSREEITNVMNNLYKRRMWTRALEFSEWLDTHKKIEFVEIDYTFRLAILGKLGKLSESYIEGIPKSFRGEMMYQTLLANYANAKNVKKAEETFNRMKVLGFHISCETCNQLLRLYKAIDKKRIRDILLLMEKEKIKLSATTYKILIDAKGESNDIKGMEHIMETMKSEDIKSDLNTKSIIAKHYISNGFHSKAKPILKEIENGINEETHWAYGNLLPLYAALGEADEVRRLWKKSESSPRLNISAAAVQAWGILKQVGEAEAIFHKMTNLYNLNSQHYYLLLKVYADNKMVSKAKEVIFLMTDKQIAIVPYIWDLVVEVYIDAGELDKIRSILEKATQWSNRKLWRSSYMRLMKEYAKKGDVHNSERMLYMMRVAGYNPGYQQFETLLEGYINAKSRAYGMKDRLLADNVYSNQVLSQRLLLVDPFRSTGVSSVFE